MTEARFEQLVNLYLDKEISPEDFAVLKQELATSAGRRRTFREFRSLRAAENRIICASYKPDPQDNVMPQPTRKQKVIAAMTQLGAFGAAASLAVALFAYATQGDFVQRVVNFREGANNLVKGPEVNQAGTFLNQFLNRGEQDNTVATSRLGDQMTVYVVIPVGNSNHPDHIYQVVQTDQLSLDEICTRNRMLNAMGDLPGTTATISMPKQQPMGFQVSMADVTESY